MKTELAYMKMCQVVASQSKDPSTKVGAIIVGKDDLVLSTGFNGFPRGVKDLDVRYFDRETKYKLIEHAERNAIYNAARAGTSLLDSTLFVQWMPCHECARAIIQSGIARIFVGNFGDEKLKKRWEESWGYSALMFAESGIELTFVDLPKGDEK